MDGRWTIMEFEKLLFRAKAGDKQAVNQIIQMYSPLLIKNSLINGVFEEDLYQELVIELLKCIRYFRKKDK
jgi:DNA-directed RNA polymerase specialized sigma subunit